jgi:hypothetical protein
VGRYVDLVDVPPVGLTSGRYRNRPGTRSDKVY